MFNIKLSKTMRDVQWSFISLATASLSHLLLRIILGKELGPAGLGLYTLVFTIYMFGMQFAAFGIGAALTKYVAEHNYNIQKAKDFGSSGILGSFISGSMMGILLYLSAGAISISFFHNSEMVDLLKITALCFPFIATQKAVLGVLNGFRKMNHFAFLNITQNILVLFVSIVLVVFFKMNVIGAVLGFIAPTIVISLIALFFVRDIFSASFNGGVTPIIFFLIKF